MIDVPVNESPSEGGVQTDGAGRVSGRVELCGVTARFGATTAVDDVSLDVRPGEFLVLLGPSGCGKTTLLRLIAGLEEPASGSVTIDGRLVNDVDPKDRDVAMVFQSYALYPHMSVAQNIAFPLRKRGVPRRDRGDLVSEAAVLVELTDLLDRKPATLSGGQRQRVALARAIVRRPSVFLMDEPLSNLDAPMRAGARTLLTELQSRLGITVVYVTHDQIEAMTMGTRIAVMHGGRLQQVGVPDEVHAEPANTFVAGFLGNPGMNLLGGRVCPGGTCVEVAGAVLDLPASFEQRREVIVGVRPEHLGPVSDGGVSVEVRASESHGHERVVRATTSDGGSLLYRVTTESSPPRAGEVVRLTAAANNVHLFDVATGVRLRGSCP